MALASARAEAACTAFADALTGKVLRQDGVCDQRITPASTFKIAISLMGYDSGFLENTESPALPFRDGYPDWIASWKATTDPASWMKNSVVWYSQRITESLGKERFARYVHAFGYGNEDVSGAPGKQDGLTWSWLSSSLKISPLEQLAFLAKIVRRELPVSPLAYEMTARLTEGATLSNGWKVHGKTGTGFAVQADGSNGSEDRGPAIGWFVGWAAKGSRSIVFVRQIQDEKKEPTYAGPRAREEFLRELPAALDSLSLQVG
ncbi:MAG: class D beta-lactamase [Thermoanaerobaculia bacterium]|jgi:beta-lactamase class D|nr:class D beta-lactamase [Thermoanaerobaculia bacterium]MBP9824984.1 class D beta-lactamase [Thermoanaerobaculia bacterium]